ncbi:tyrosine-type recombinase/integrase [Lysinibacillus sp. FSL K6-0057]|uniref:tyrosine-type recombinase/integrase n=1 Tax=Lysinibacillus sp. FSL K6-0057 TaxID=2921411 RepID=UPI0031599E9B
MDLKINIVERFQEWLQEEGKATKTIESYITDVKLFQQYLVDKDADPDVLLTRFYFTSYLKQLEKECLAIATINKKINSLKVYNDWLIQEKIVTDSVIRLKRDRLKIANGSEAEVSVLTPEQVDALLFHVEKESNRNKLICYLLLFTGVRVSELVNLKLTDVDRLTAQLSVRGKGGKFRDIPLRKDVLEVLEQYVSGERAANKFADSPFLLLSQRAGNMHRDGVRRFLEQTGQQLGFHIHPHMMRHTFCTRLLKAGVELSTVSRLAGHANFNMTVKYYINTSKEEKQNAVDLL